MRAGLGALLPSARLRSAGSGPGRNLHPSVVGRGCFPPTPLLGLEQARKKFTLGSSNRLATAARSGPPGPVRRRQTRPARRRHKEQRVLRARHRQSSSACELRFFLPPSMIAFFFSAASMADVIDGLAINNLDVVLLRPFATDHFLQASA